MDEIINKVALSPLITIDLEEYYPEGERVSIDIKEQLLEGFLLRERDFRTFIEEHKWSQYEAKYVAVFCSHDAIIPRWAWMLMAVALEPYAKKIVFGNLEALESALYSEILGKFNPEDFRDQKVVVKGCSKKPVPVSAYVELSALLRPVVKSIMYGEPCSTVPVYKNKNKS
ncbi:DUF2480 family protein [soil metagenome]